MVNRDSPAYQAGRLVSRVVLIGLGYIMGKRWGRKPIDKSFPEKKKININNMFGSRNFTALSFVAKIKNFGIEFTIGIVEEVTFNITGSAVAHAAEVPENINVKFISKDQFITSTSVVVSSKIAQTNLFGLIAGATPNLIF